MLESEQAFLSLRKLLFNKCMSTIPLASDCYRLQTDASGLGIGAVLSVVRENDELPVAYFSRQLRSVECHYSSTELECLAVVAAIKHSEVYLAGRSFELQTDHQALTGLLSSKNHN